MRPNYCEAIDEDTPCICGATKDGKDPVHGVCQARYPYPKPKPILSFVLIDKRTGETVAEQTVLS